MKKFVLFFVLLFAAVPGCSVAPFVGRIVTGVIMWKEGEAQKYYNEETDLMYHSTKLALKELNLPITKNEPIKDGYYILAGDKDRFKIHIHTIRPHITKVSIRINFMGDKPFAELIYKSIDSFTDTIDFENGRPIRGKKFVRFQDRD